MPKLKSSYSHPYVVDIKYAAAASRKEPPRYAKLGQAVSAVRSKLEANVEWARKFSTDSIEGIVGAIERLNSVKMLDPGGVYEDRVVVDNYTGAAFEYRIIREN